MNFSISPTKIHIRKEYSKTKVARQIYISDEATKYLKPWIDWKYNRGRETVNDDQVSSDTETPSPDNDLVFSIHTIKKEPDPNHVYIKLLGYLWRYR